VEGECSPAVQRKVVSASTRGASYTEASEALEELAELAISAKQCERITQRIGKERLQERATRCEQFEKLSIPEQKWGKPTDAPANSWDGRVAAVLLDGGRAQMRDERWGTPKIPGETRSWWREPKIACLTTYQSRPSTEDPMPEVPECLLDPLFVIPRVMEMKRARGGLSGNQQPEASAAELEPPPSDSRRWSPEPLVRSVVGTLGSYDELGRLAEVEAWHRGFATAPRRAFLGDGLLANWSVHRKRFSGYIAILDLMHGLTYVYTGALESSPDMETCWHRYCRWITWVWQGKVESLLEELGPLVPAATEPARRESLEDCLGYLTRNAGRMRYPEYRQQGLPITTVLAESTIKQINRRMKGTEKFWHDGGEPQLQLCCDRISQTQPLDAFWNRRSARQTGFRKSRASP
jgi:hypothetical protein